MHVDKQSDQNNAEDKWTWVFRQMCRSNEWPKRSGRGLVGVLLDFCVCLSSVFCN